MDNNKAAIIRSWLDSLKIADESLRLSGAAFEHRQNLQNIQSYFNNKLLKETSGQEYPQGEVGRLLSDNSALKVISRTWRNTDQQKRLQEAF